MLKVIIISMDWFCIWRSIKLKTDVCRFDIHGYPTMKFFAKDNKAGENYHGNRDLDSLVTFINEKCGTSRDAQGHLTSDVSALIPN